MKKITKLEQIEEINLQENNLLYLYGKTGSGKTYLSRKLAKQSKKEVFYIDFKQMMQNISNELYINSMESKIIVIDDEIKQLAGKEVSSLRIEEILKEMQNKGSYIIILSSLTPEELSTVKSSLTKFILSGIQIELCYDIESRIKIAEVYNKQYQTKIEKGILESIAKKEENLGKIRGIMNQMSINYETY